MFNAREIYERNSKQVSDSVRQLSLAAIAIVWLFKMTDANGQSRIVQQLVPATLLIAIALGLDFLQYVYATIAWGRLIRKAELENSEPERAPAWLNWPTITLFGAKIVAMLVAYVLLASYLIGRVV